MKEAVRKRLETAMRTNHGVISYSSALALGATNAGIRQQVSSGRWTRLHRGVYAVAGVPVTPLVCHAAALSAAGHGAALSHRSAAWLWGLAARPPGTVALSVPPGHRPRIAGTHVHTAAPGPPALRQGLAVTEPVRTLIDLASMAGAGELDAAIDRAVAGELAITSLTRLIAAVQGGGPHAGRRGVGALRRALEARGDLGAPAPSVLESRMARLFRVHRVPLPDAEVAVDGGRYRLDYAYPERRLAVEVHGYLWHHSPEQARRDHARHNHLQGDRWTVLIYTWRDVVSDGPRVAAEIAAAWLRLVA